MVGISNSAFGTLAAVYGGEIGLPVATIAFFSSLPILLGALTQIPVGILSDRYDRRIVLIGVAVVALAAGGAFIALAPQGATMNLALVAVFGGAIYAMYPVIIAHANDNAPDGNYIMISGGLLMIFGIGSIVGPLAAGAAMSSVGPTGLFMTSVVAHVLLILQAIYRINKRPSLPREEKTDFVPVPGVRTTTPETIVLGASEEDFARARARGTASAREFVPRITLDVEKCAQVPVVHADVDLRRHHGLRVQRHARARPLQHPQIVGPVPHGHDVGLADPQPRRDLLERPHLRLAPEDRLRRHPQQPPAPPREARSPDARRTRAPRPPAP